MRIPILLIFAAIMFAATLAPPAMAGKADVVGVKVTKGDPGVYHFAVTVRHYDTGWEHYADAWEVLGPDGKILATRVLTHPHENEQPFTRYLNDVEISKGIHKVRLRAHDKVHGYGGVEMMVDLPQ